MTGFKLSLLGISFLAVIPCYAETTQTNWLFRAETGALWQGRNDFRRPGNTGDLVSLPTVTSNAAALSTRLYITKQISENQFVRALVAPFSQKASGTLSNNVLFEDLNLTPSSPIDFEYQFNSYRLGYQYRFFRDTNWDLRLGFTAKIRDAKIGVTQNGQSRRFTNVGFVPLAYLMARYQTSEKLSFALDIDGLGAPQGRAIDLWVGGEYVLTPAWTVDVGYRVLEGGADNDRVFSFSLFHYVVAGLSYKI